MIGQLTVQLYIWMVLLGSAVAYAAIVLASRGIKHLWKMWQASKEDSKWNALL